MRFLNIHRFISSAIHPFRAAEKPDFDRHRIAQDSGRRPVSRGPATAGLERADRR